MRSSPFDNTTEHRLSWHWLSQQPVNEKQTDKATRIKYGKTL
jgi:hypothetical protein